MVNFVLVQLAALILAGSALASIDRVHSEGYLGEKRLDSYSERYQPLIFQDIYQGKMAFTDEVFFQNYFRPYLLQPEEEISFFLRSELGGGITCPNELLSQHFDDIRYSYRLVTLSYLLEGQWHMKLISDHFRMKDGCRFDLQQWAKSCRPKSESMKKFLSRLATYAKYEESLPEKYGKSDWWKEFTTGKHSTYSHYRTKEVCSGKCYESEMPAKFKYICAENQRLMDLICSEEDELYGLSNQRDAYYLLGRSNIINTYNKQGEAMGCLRRFSEMMAHKEVNYRALRGLFPVLQTQLRQKYEERFLQGRVFFYGAGKEFEEKGLKDLYVKEQKLKIKAVPKMEEPKVVESKPAPVVVPAKPKEGPKVVVAPPSPKKEVVEIKTPPKSAFLLASEIRAAQNLERVEVDMLKLKYDYVFTLNMMNTLSERLKTFMTREALTEMMTYDKLGTKEGPVPLLFIKFMIDMEEHHGLWNMLAILGDKFYVSNEIDASFKPASELVQLVNNETTGGHWQLFVLRPQ